MLSTGAAKKLTIYISETDTYQGARAYEVLLEWLDDHGVAGATVTRAIAGYGSDGQMHTLRAFRIREDVPMRIEVVESAEKINRILPFVYDIVDKGLIELSDTTVVKCRARDEAGKNEAEDQPMPEHIKLEGQARMLRIYIGESDRWEGEPLYEAIVKKLRMMDVAGATVYRGIMGYGANQRVRKTGFLHLSHDLPVMITIVDSEEKIRRAVAALDGMVDDGMVVLSDVEVIKYTHAQKDSSHES
jgi:PII-like signaling protein